MILGGVRVPAWVRLLLVLAVVREMEESVEEQAAAEAPGAEAPGPQ